MRLFRGRRNVPLLGNVFVPLHKRVPDDIDGVKANESAVLTKDSCGENHAALDRLAARLQEAERERDVNWAEAATNAAKWKAAEAREAVLREALTNIVEHDPPEVVKDNFAYDRLKAAYRECALDALATADPGAAETFRLTPGQRKTIARAADPGSSE